MEADLVLAPVDGSDESTTAVRYALAVADEYDAAVRAVYVLDESTAGALESGSVDPATVREETGDYLAELSALAADAGVPLRSSMAMGFSTRVKTRHPGSVVLDLAGDADVGFVVVPHEPGADGGDTLERAAEYVLLYASQPVLSV